MKIHFIGIGGIGLSALAKFLVNDGHKISGSDIKQTEITNDLATLICFKNNFIIWVITYI